MAEELSIRFAFFDHNANFGGAPKGTVELVSRLNQQNSVEIYDAFGGCAEYRKAILDNNIEYFVCLPKAAPKVIGGTGLNRLANLVMYLPTSFLMTIALYKIIRLRKPSVVWVNNIKSLLPVFLVGRILKVRTVLYIRGEVSRSTVSKFYLLLTKYCTSHVICNSKAATLKLSQFGISPRKVSYIPNSVAIQPQGKSVYKVSAQRPIIILPAARPTADKGYEECIEAFAKFREKNNVGSLYLLGRLAFSNKSDFLDSMKNKVKLLGIEEHVNWVGYTDLVADYIQQSDIVVLPSYTEGFPRVILEAMLLKRPFVCTPVADIGEIVSEYSVGLICEIKNSNSLYQCLDFIYKNPNDTERMVGNAYRYVKENHTAELQVTRVSKLLTSLL